MLSDAFDLSPPEPFSALIFDCDGTLADTMPMHMRAMIDSFGAYSLHLPEAWFLANGGLSSRQFIEEFIRESHSNLDPELIVAAHEQRFLELLPDVREISSVTAIARAWHGRVPMAVSSGGVYPLVFATLKTLAIDSLFDAIVTVDQVSHGKPAPDLFFLAAEKLGVAPLQCVVYEDSSAGIEAARRADMRCVVVG